MTLAFVCVEVLIPEGMTVLAMSLRGVFCSRTKSASGVLAIRHGLEVIGVDAGSVSAEMVDDQTGWDWSFRFFVGDSVRHAYLMPFAIAPVAVRPDVPVPKDAWRRVGGNRAQNRTCSPRCALCATVAPSTEIVVISHTRDVHAGQYFASSTVTPACSNPSAPMKA